MTPKKIRKAAFFASIGVFLTSLGLHVFTAQYTLAGLIVAWVLAMVAVDQKQIKIISRRRN